MSRKWRYTCAGGKRLREAITATGTTDGCRYKREAAAMTALENWSAKCLRRTLTSFRCSKTSSPGKRS